MLHVERGSTSQWQQIKRGVGRGDVLLAQVNELRKALFLLRRTNYFLALGGRDNGQSKLMGLFQQGLQRERGSPEHGLLDLLALGHQWRGPEQFAGRFSGIFI